MSTILRSRALALSILALLLALAPAMTVAQVQAASDGKAGAAAASTTTTGSLTPSSRACTFKPPKRAFLRWNQYDRGRISINWTGRKRVTSYSVILFALEGSTRTWVAGTVPGGYRGLSVTMNDIRGELGTGWFRAAVYAHRGKCYSDGSASTSGNIDNRGYYNFADPLWTDSMKVRTLIHKTYRVNPHYYVDECGKLSRHGVPVVLSRAVKDRTVDTIVSAAIKRGLIYVVAPEGILGKLAIDIGVKATQPLVRKFTPRAVYCLIP